MPFESAFIGEYIKKVFLWVIIGVMFTLALLTAAWPSFRAALGNMVVSMDETGIGGLFNPTGIMGIFFGIICISIVLSTAWMYFKLNN